MFNYEQIANFNKTTFGLVCFFMNEDRANRPIQVDSAVQNVYHDFANRTRLFEKITSTI